MIKVFSDTKGLIFDCDGTLVDSMPLHIEAWKSAFAYFGETCPEDFLDPLKGKNLGCYCELDQLCHADVILEFLKKKKELAN